MLEKPLNKLIFYDIETSSQYPTLSDAPETVQKIFKRRYKGDIEKFPSPISDSEHTALLENLYNVKAALSPEFGRILCISLGTFTLPAEAQGDYVLKMTSFSGKDEKVLLGEFLKRTEVTANKMIPEFLWVGHNSTHFDAPFISKRILYNRLPLPRLWDYGNLKPWELGDRFIDTKVVISYGIYDSAVSLEHLCYLLGVPSSKDAIEGSQVKDAFWIDDNLEGIVSYCNKDVAALCECYLRLKNMNNNVVIK